MNGLKNISISQLNNSVSTNKILLYSVQKVDVLEEILLGTYKPKFSMSKGAIDKVASRSYYFMISELVKKTGRKPSGTCIWSWYQNPYFINNIDVIEGMSNYCVITFEMNIEDVVFSNFDDWNKMYIDEDFSINPIVSFRNIRKEDTIQAVTWGIPKSNIVAVESFENHLIRYRNCLNSLVRVN